VKTVLLIYESEPVKVVNNPVPVTTFMGDRAGIDAV